MFSEYSDCFGTKSIEVGITKVLDGHSGATSFVFPAISFPAKAFLRFAESSFLIACPEQPIPSDTFHIENLFGAVAPARHKCIGSDQF